MLLLLLLLAAPLPHGGQYQPPEPDHAVTPEVQGIVAQPGLGPELVFEPSRWEWWFDFNQELLLRLRSRLARSASAAGGTPYQPVSDDLRTSAVLPALVEAVRPEPQVVAGIRRSPNPRDVRSAAVLAMGRLQRPEAVPYIELVAENDPDLFVRTQAVLALGFSGSPNAAETLSRIYRNDDQDAEIRTYAAAGLGLIGNAQAIDVLRAGLTEKALSAQNNQLRAGSLYAAGLPADPVLGAALRDLSSTWLYEKEPQLRAVIGMSLGRVADPESRALLMQLLEDPDTQVRRSAAAGLGAVGEQLDADAIQLMIARYADESDSAVRTNLLHALGRARQPESRAWLRSTFESATFEYRPHAALALGMDGDPGNTAVLLEALAELREESTVAATVLALGLLEDDAATDELLARLESARAPFLRGYLCLALGLINPPRPELAAQLDAFVREENDIELIRWALIGLGLVGARDRIDGLAADVPALGGTVRRAAVLHGLGLVGDSATVAPLLAVFRDAQQPDYVRTYALQALGELTDPRNLSPAGRLSQFVELNHEVGFIFELYRVL